MRFSSTIKALAVTAVVAAGANAQFYTPWDARQASIAGGLTTMGDFYDVYKYPVLMFEYPNRISATVGPHGPGGIGGGVLGTYSINDKFTVGVAANQGLVPILGLGGYLSGGDTIVIIPSFANTAIGYLNSEQLPRISVGNFTFADNGDLWKSNIPHLLFGLNLGTVKLGADVFFEYARYSNSGQELRQVYIPDRDTTITTQFDYDYSGIMLNPGARFSADIDIGNLGILAKAGVSLPSFEVRNEENAIGAQTITNSIKSDKGIYVELGTELSMSLEPIDLMVGTEYTYTEHSVKNIPTTYWNSLFQLYTGGEFKFLTAAKASVKYAFYRVAWTTKSISTANNVAFIADEVVSAHLHGISAGMENVWDKAYFFDNVALRAGAYYTIVDWVGSSSETPSLRSRDWKRFAEHTVAPSIGFGVTKSFLTIDLYCDLGDWEGAFTGPAVVAATATIKF